MVGGLDFSGKKVKTPTLPKAGRVGHLKNLNQTLRIDESQLKDWPPAKNSNQRARKSERTPARKFQANTIPTTSSIKLEAFFTPGMYFVGWPHRFRKSRASPSVVFSPLSKIPKS
jgi:hypothetical protein